MLKHILLRVSLLLALFSLASCGGGGGSGGSGNSTLPLPGNYTTAIVKIGLSGTLPANTAISGVMFTLFFPSTLSPALTNGTVAANAVTLSGAYAGGMLTAPVYTPPTTAAMLGKLEVTLADTSQSGVSQLGEVARITLLIANGTVPTVGNFIVSTNGVIDVEGKPISTVSAVVTEVIVQ
jgi:hypothetical protein